MYKIIKRILDITLSLFAIFIFSPLLAAIAFLIAIESKGGVFFTQNRIGKDGKTFKMIKFRTMCKDAQAKGNPITSKDDYRITRIGKFLRDYKIDEFPNFFNVLIGHMSLVGPRPEVEDYKSEFSGEKEELLDIKPGITGPNQLYYFYEYMIVPTMEVTPEFYKYHLNHKMKLDLEYKRNASLVLDMKYLVKTVFRVFFAEDGLYPAEKDQVEND